MVALSAMSFFIVRQFKDLFRFFDAPASQVSHKGKENRPKIAFLTSYVESDMWTPDPDTGGGRPILNMLGHITNRACYCHLWNYDCIFNQKHELSNFMPQQHTSLSDEQQPNRWWLKFGCWERVAHLQAALPRYDWVLYGDIDYIIKDMTRPIESFVHEFELYGKDEVHVLVPSDNDDNDRVTAFSSFAVLIKNSPFGRKLVENWRAFAMGICPNGNFASKDGEYEWYHGGEKHLFMPLDCCFGPIELLTFSLLFTDQPGLWYALMKTHMDFYPNDAHHPPSIITCNSTTGLIDDSNTGPWLNFDEYFVKNGLKAGNYGEHLDRVPDNQPIIFSKSGNESRSGLGVDHNWAYNEKTGQILWNYAFALHQKATKEHWNPNMQRELAICQNVHGCAASLNETTGMIETGCHDVRA